MMKRLVVAVSLAAAPLYAQGVDPQCAPGSTAIDPNTITSDACQKAVDLFQYMAPQLGISLTGGNPVLGQGGTVGGIGHFRFDLRANVLMGSLPKVQEAGVNYGGAQQSSYVTTNQVLGMPSANAEIGLFGGLPLGITKVGGVDALLTGTYVPNVNTSNVSLQATAGNLKVGYGARIGLLQETILVPGVSATWMKRDLPSVDIATSVSDPSGASSDLLVRNLSQSTTAWRIMASKSLILFSLAAGMGQDKYDSKAAVTADVNYSGVGTRRTIDMKQSLTRTNYFADISMNLILFKIVGEVGQVSGGKVATYNRFDAPADKSRLYGSVGIRAGF
jgi:hypothetical protein